MSHDDRPDSRNPRSGDVDVGVVVPERAASSDYYSPRPVPAHPFEQTQWYQRQLSGKAPPEHRSPAEPWGAFPANHRAKTLHDTQPVFSAERLRMDTWRLTIVVSWIDNPRDKFRFF